MPLMAKIAMGMSGGEERGSKGYKKPFRLQEDERVDFRGTTSIRQGNNLAHSPPRRAGFTFACRTGFRCNGLTRAGLFSITLFFGILSGRHSATVYRGGFQPMANPSLFSAPFAYSSRRGLFGRIRTTFFAWGPLYTFL